MKLKKNSMYLMHLVQPATAMLPVWIKLRPFAAANQLAVPGHTLCARATRVYLGPLGR